MANKNPKTKKTEAPAAKSLPPTTKAAKTTAGAKPPVPKKASAPVKTTEKAAPNAAKQTAETKAPEGKKTVSARKIRREANDGGDESHQNAACE